jgi:hypothetical protein
MISFFLKFCELRRLCLLLLSLIVVSPLWSQSTTVVIDEVYGGGNGTSASATYLYNQDYVELFNLSDSTVDISNWSVQYFSASGVSASAANVAVIPANTTLAPGQRYLIGGAASTYGGALPVTPDLLATFDMSSGQGKVYLSGTSTRLTSQPCPETNTNVVDYMGYAATASALSCFEGSTAGDNPAPVPGSVNIDVRTNPCVDNANNGVDYTAAPAPAPRNSTSTPTPCTAPMLSAPTATPSTLYSGSSTLLTVTATKGASSTLNVTVDTSALGGSSTQVLYDDGTHGDVTAGDGIYSYSLAVPTGQTASTYMLNFTATDTDGRTGTASTSLVVQTPIASGPISLSNAKTTPANVTAGGTALLTVAFTPGTLPTSSGVSITADLSAFGGSATQPLNDAGTNGDATASDGTYSYQFTVPSGQAAQAYPINISAADSQLRSAGATATLTVQAPIAPAATIALSSSASTVMVGSSVTFTAVVTGNMSSTPGGTVTFYDGGAQLGMGTSTIAGTYIFSTSSLALGVHSITAVYSGDGVYPGYTTPLADAASVTISANPIGDFTLTLSSPTLTATAGYPLQAINVTMGVENNFNGTVNFSCSGLPAYARCTFSPSTLSSNGTSMLTIGIDNVSLPPGSHSPFRSHGGETALALACLALPLAMRRRLRQSFGLAGTMLGALLFGAALLGVVGCSGGVTTNTPDGNSTIIVTGTAGGLSHSATLTLTVQ